MTGYYKDVLMDEMKRFKEVINGYIHDLKSGLEGPRDLIEASFHLVLSGGKRVRPFILVKAAELFGVSEEETLPAAVSIELLHNFTLIHDDIMDRDEFRRGVKTTHVLYGEPLAIVAGDYLFSLVFKLLTDNYSSEVASRLVELYAEASMLICRGQTMDILPDKYIHVSSDYMEMVYQKTGALIEASAVAGGVIAKVSSEELGYLRTFGKKIGIAFQIADDILGVVGDPKVTGKPVGNDIRNGKRTLIVLLAESRMDAKERRMFDGVFGRLDASDEDIAKVVEIFDKHNVFSDARDLMNKLYGEALDALRKLPPTKARTYLEYLSRFIIEREK